MRTERKVKRGLGSPAWAGIDLIERLLSGGRSRFPRVGGDRPLLGGGSSAQESVPPRGRG